MKRIVLLVSVFLSLGLAAFTTAYGQDVDADIDEAEASPLAILELELKSSLNTNYYPDCGEDCMPWSTWFLYKANVKRVLYGNYQEPTIEFVRLQHAGLVNVKNSTVFVEIDEFTNANAIENLGTLYFATDFEFPREIVCLRTSMIEALDDTDFFDDVEHPWIKNAYDIHDDENESCFYTSDLREKR